MKRGGWVGAFIAASVLAWGVADGPEELERLRGRVGQLEAELAHERAERAEIEARLRLEIAALRTELGAALEVRMGREREWLEYTRLFAQLGPAGLGAEHLFLPQVPAEELEFLLLEEPAVQDDTEPARGRSARDREVFLALRSLLVVEGIDGIELLESGRVSTGATGPVVVRSIDAYGRSVGTLAAARLRLEGSRAARTLTMVLEDGYERIGGRRIPFEGSAEGSDRGGVRRIHLGRVDPSPWIRALPELFRPSDAEVVQDDGLWDLLAVRMRLNELLERDTVGGSWRVRALGGVRGGELRDVMLEQRDGGRALRQVVADRMRLVTENGGLVLVLEGGAQLADGRKFPFLDDRYRIYLPRADVEAWRAAGLPGFVVTPPAALGRALTER